MDHNRNDQEVLEKLVRLNRIAKVVKGGRRFSFSALSVVGDRNGNVGYGFGKANYVTDAIRKSIDRGRQKLERVPLKKGTIPYPITGVYKSARVFMKPAAPGTGIIAGGPVRAVMEAAGIRDVLTKSMGSRNPMNVVKAVFNGLEQLMDARAVSTSRGKTLREFWG